MQINSYKKYIYIIVLLVIFGGFFLFNQKRQAPKIQPLPNPPLIKGGELITPDKGEDKGVLEKEVVLTYTELITKGHELYLKGVYAGALSYFKKALVLEENDRIYRSLYSAYLALKDYKNAEMSIQKAVSLSRAIPNNWVEYAYFENYYMKAPFDVVSKIYLDGLEATKDNIDLITGYIAYLTENKKYPEAIALLEKAIIKNPARKATFQAEIDYLRTLQ